jgi:ribosomal protein S8E
LQTERHPQKKDLARTEALSRAAIVAFENAKATASANRLQTGSQANIAANGNAKENQ